MAQLVALVHPIPSARRKDPVVAVDLGFSTSAASCGVAAPAAPGGLNHHFGRAVTAASNGLTGARQGVLILEAPLSARFGSTGRPCSRGTFEDAPPGAPQSTRYWSEAPGVGVAYAAVFFLRKLLDALSTDSVDIELVEGFVSRGAVGGAHSHVAATLRSAFLAGAFTAHSVPTSGSGETISVLDLLLTSTAPHPPPAIIEP